MKQHAWALALTVAVAPLAPVATAPAEAALDSMFTPQELGNLSSVATVEDASALAVNPAALAFQRSSELFLSRSVNGLQQTNLFLTGGGVGSAWRQFYTPQGRFLNNFTFGGAVDLHDTLSLGGTLSYLQFLDSQGGNSADFALSMLYRPNAWLSAGLKVDHITSPPIGAGVQLPRLYRGGVAFRPGTDRLTVSLDGLWQERDPLAAITPVLGLQGEVIPGLVARGMVDNQLNYSVGLGLKFGQFTMGGLSGVTNGRVGPSDSFYVATSDLTDRRHLNLGFSRMAYMRLEGELLDLPLNAFDLRQQYYPGVLHLTQRIQQAKLDPKITGLVLDMRGVASGLGKLQELRDAITDFEASGKATIAYVSSPSIGEYYLATACDKIVQHPSGSLDVKGLTYPATFLKGTFDKLGIQPQFVSVGKYKSAPETYTRQEFSGPAKEEAQELLDAQFAQIVEGIAKARRLSTKEVMAIVDKGLFTPPAAKEANLVDEVAYPDQVPGMFEKGPAHTYALQEYKPGTWGTPDVLAVVTIDGAITRGESGGDLINGQSSGSATITRALREIRRDDRIKSVVIRVDSPGGDATASDEIGREIDLLRLAGKPVIISMGDVAASGGYWVAANGARIYAEPGTVTGSIGVFSGFFAYGGLLNKLGVTTQTLKRGEHADMETGFRPLSEQELTMLRDQARYTYVQFLERVAAGRRMSTSRVDEIAQGRVWAGDKAQDIGLVDKLAGLEAALEDARKEGKLEPETTVLEFYPKPGSLWETLDDSTMDAQLRNTVKAAQEYRRAKTWLLMTPPATTPQP
jgi:protease-4